MIDIQKMQQSYLVEFIRILYIEAKAKFPKDPLIQLTYAHFSLFYIRNCFVCLNLLRSFKSKNLSFFDKLSYKLNEALLIYQLKHSLKKKDEFENGFQYKMYGVVNDESLEAKGSIPHLFEIEKLEAEHFIRINTLSLNYNQGIQFLGLELIDFWKFIL